ncbi:hypothetical protein NLG97_g8524 [Lecanicillium saksenae]|uniref:Uncharacterized protein n=1 Tax=Lecanicillium saksenae TaxID=468837 RepID=A0ACC1QKL5_9HYPO|nr:hypothetical protein NLG97_g8524 [Lecanicillium saksenae]
MQFDMLPDASSHVSLLLCFATLVNISFTAPPRDKVFAAFKKAIDAKPLSLLESLGISVQDDRSQESYPPCAKAIGTLTPMLLTEMSPEKHHRGRMIVVRACHPRPGRTCGILTIVEDETGNVIPLVLFNMAPEAAIPADQIIPEGTLCLIKEPYFKIDTKDFDHSLRVHHVSDIVFPDATDSRVPAAWRKPAARSPSKEIRLQVNAKVKEKNWTSALQLYSRAINTAETKEERELASVNRALVNLRLSHFEAALFDCAESAIAAVPTMKSLFRTAMAHYGLGDFARCHRVEERLHEQATGQYSFARMYQQAETSPHLVDCANFYEPIEARPSPLHGRGLFLTEDLSVGDLIMCEKASAYSLRAQHKKSDVDMFAFVVRQDSPSLDRPAHEALDAQLQQKLLHNSDAHRPIMDLWCGTEHPPQSTADSGAGTVFDSPRSPHILANKLQYSFVVENIVYYNGMICSAPAATRSGRAGSNDVTMLASGGRPARASTLPAAGLWLKASYMNHACYANCSRVCIGDMLVVRAARDLVAGTELTVAYSAPEALEHQNVVKEKLAYWDVVCACSLCEARERVATQSENGQRTIVDVITDTLALATPASTGTVAIIDAIAAALRGAGFEVEHSAEHFAIRKWGMMQYRLPEVLEQLHNAYEQVHPQACPVIKDYARTAYLVMSGEDETFIKSHPTLAAA